ncbi:MAG: LEA type 2 family protein [Gammaproteobacteria bacterium]
MKSWQRNGVHHSSHVMVLAITLLLCACAGSVIRPVAPGFEIDRVDVVDWAYPVAHMVVSITVTNPNNFDIQLDDVDLHLHIMAQSVASGKLSDDAVLPAQQAQLVRMPVAVNFANGMPVMLQLLSGVDVPYKLSGSVRLKNYSKVLPIAYDGRLSRPVSRVTAPRV